MLASAAGGQLAPSPVLSPAATSLGLKFPLLAVALRDLGLRAQGLALAPIEAQSWREVVFWTSTHLAWEQLLAVLTNPS